MINKELMRDRFAKNLKNYDENAKIQKRMAKRLMDFISNKSPQNILEIGCGTGFLTKLIKQKLDYKKLTTIDIVKDCEYYIKNIDNNIEFIGDDIEEFLKNNSNKYDLIISNASLQWIENFENVIISLKGILTSDGELIFSTFGPENFREIYHVIGTTLKYYSIFELQKMFQNSIIEPEIHIMAFNTPKDVLKHLQLTGVNGVENKTWTKKDLTKFENGYQNICNRRPTLTYNPIYIKITKENDNF